MKDREGTQDRGQQRRDTRDWGEGESLCLKEGGSSVLGPLRVGRQRKRGVLYLLLPGRGGCLQLPCAFQSQLLVKRRSQRERAREETVRAPVQQGVPESADSRGLPRPLRCPPGPGVLRAHGHSRKLSAPVDSTFRRALTHAPLLSSVSITLLRVLVASRLDNCNNLPRGLPALSPSLLRFILHAAVPEILKRGSDRGASPRSVNSSVSLSPPGSNRVTFGFESTP
uniref:Uncharacterized protein LOC110220173 n=1 Tax=Phascolarctos cinereus TaxID=38626 RepID=A0A6P5LMX8_PHACI|nr:uncharacterized protein LOC110220173 [Phascolarctos cinereus]